MKLEPVTKLDKRNKTMSKKFDDDVMSENFDVIAIFPIHGQFGAILKPDSGQIVCKIYVSLIVTENRPKKSLTQLSHYCFE